MPLLLLKNLPRYECLLEAAKEFPDLDPSAVEAFLHLLYSGDECFRATESNFTDHNITQGRFGVLMALLNRCRQDGEQAMLSPAELAERAGVTRATMTGLVDTLERDGLVTRAPDSQDRRMLTVCLTAKGREVLHGMLPEHFRRIATLMRSLTEVERKTLVGLLTKIQEQAARMSTASSATPVPVAT